MIVVMLLVLNIASDLNAHIKSKQAILIRSSICSIRLAQAYLTAVDKFQLFIFYINITVFNIYFNVCYINVKDPNPKMKNLKLSKFEVQDL